jgi:hypothetical protein
LGEKRVSREEIHKLLGGYATDTLTNAERKALFEAAMEDQDLFDALAAEQPLRELLQDDRARRELLAVLEPAKQPTPKQRVFSRAWIAAAASVCVAAIALGLVWRMQPARQNVTFVAQAPVVADHVLQPPVALPQASQPVAPKRSQDLSRRESAPTARMAAAPATSNEPQVPPPAPMMAGAPAALEMQYIPAPSEAKKEALEEARGDLAGRSQAIPESTQVGKVTIPLQAKFVAQRYRLFKKDSAGVFQELPAPDVSRGDTILFEVTPSRDGQLTVSMSGDNDVQTVFAGLVNAGVPYRVPLGGLVIAGEPGARTFSIRWSTPPRDMRVVQQSFKDKSSLQVAGAYGQRSEPDEVKLVLTVR